MIDRRRDDDRPFDVPDRNGDYERIDKRTDVGWDPPTERDRPPPDSEDQE